MNIKLYIQANIIDQINVHKKAITKRISGSNGFVHDVPVSLLANAVSRTHQTNINVMKTINAIKIHTINQSNVFINTCRRLGFAGSISIIDGCIVAI